MAFISWGNNISNLYKGLIERNRAFASFKRTELDVIYADIKLSKYESRIIFDPMSGYGGTMHYFGKQGYDTINVELNPPSYYWQVLTNPCNSESISNIIKTIEQNIDVIPKYPHNAVVSDTYFSEDILIYLQTLFESLSKVGKGETEQLISVLLPFSSRFACYQRSSKDITHIKEGGLCLLSDWEVDFRNYLQEVNRLISKDKLLYGDTHHKTILSDIMNIDFNEKYKLFVMSPPYPNYRDYSKIFRIENVVLERVFLHRPYDFSNMVGSNVVKGKTYGEIIAPVVQKFLNDLQEKAKKIKKKGERDITTYYYPYFSQYFYGMQQVYHKINTLLDESCVGYIVVNDNITRDILIPVGQSICETFQMMGYSAKDIDVSEVSHMGNLARSAKRINSRHIRHIIKVWKR